MTYRVIISIKDQWWSDQKRFSSFGEARTHRVAVAARWTDCDTAIAAADGRVLAFQESEQFRNEIARIRKEENAEA